MRNAFVVVFLLATCIGAGAQGDGDKEAFKAIDGIWIPLEGELSGDKFPPEVLKTIKLEVKAGSYIAHVGDVVDEGTIKLDTKQKPAAMDIVGTKGPNKGKTTLAIYEQTGDTMRVCYDLSGKKRPTAFKTEKGTTQFHVVYKRQ